MLFRYMIERYPLLSIHDAYLKTLDAGTGRFPTSRIQKGLVLGLGNRDLSEEGVGFGERWESRWRILFESFNHIL